MLDAWLQSANDSRSFLLSGDGPWRLGRGLEAELCIADDPACSRLQARIARDGDSFIIEPLSGSTPTVLNGRPIRGQAGLDHGAVIAFAGQRMIFQREGMERDADDDEDDGSAFTRMAGDPRNSPGVSPFDYLALDKAITVGRQPAPGQVVFDHPAISRRHAAFEPVDGGIVLRDLGSTNGTFVNGVRLAGSARLKEGDRIDLGPFQLVFDGTGLQRFSRTGNSEIAAFAVSKDVWPAGRNGPKLRLLHGVTLRIRPRSLVCIMGASGSGKSTLMNILAGRGTASEGVVELNGQDLHANFSALKQDIAFVPQQDELHEQLTLRQALTYAAKLRLPPDTTPAQREATIEAAARSVDLVERLDTRITALSGGQKKRASLASEILNRPSLLFLDEVTSGLDERTDWEIMRLLRRLADEGMTIVAVTHTLANVEEFCHDIICMGRGGYMTFAGPPAGALRFFGVERLGGLFNRMEDGGAQQWGEKFAEGAGMASGTPRGNATKIRHSPEPVAARLGRMVRQFAILTHRNLSLLLNDSRTLRMAALQSVLIGGLMGYAFESFGEGWQKVNSENALLLLLGFLAIWLGCNAASKDIVGELVIYRRERDINLSTLSFVAAKYVVSGVFAMLQLVVASLMVTLFAEAMPGGLPAQLPPLLIGCAAGTAIGLVISAFSDTRDQATTIVPLALVPQLVLAGVLVPKLPWLAGILAKLAVSGYWLTEAMKSVFIAVSGPIMVPDARTGTPVAMSAQPTMLGITVLLLHTTAFLTLAYAVTFVRNGRPQK
jgi:ABC-type multidrug transport system ATPase subunit/pSer/pThr/pTyr-binding forkhead associated (FHA) protein